MTTSSKMDILIIGAGVIGLSLAYELSKRGAKVTVIDQALPGYGCSYGNAGWITPGFSQTLPMPGMLMRATRWLFDPVSPLYIKPEANRLYVKWLSRFIRSMNWKTANRSLNALFEISKYSLDEYRKLDAETKHTFEFEQNGLLMVSQTSSGVDLAVKQMERATQHGITGRRLSVADIKELEPAITGKIKGGVFFPHEAHAEPLAVVETFKNLAIRHGVTIMNKEEAVDFQFIGNKLASVITNKHTFFADQFVLAAGAWSNALGNKLKLSLPILGGKGYAIIVPTFNPLPKIPVFIVDKRIAITPRQRSVRLAGTLELVNLDFSITQRRVNAIVQGAQQYMNIPTQPDLLEVWRGLRPCSPDGMPIISYSPHYSNLFITTGHQLLGLQSAPGSAYLAADLITGKTPIFDPTPFSASRF